MYAMFLLSIFDGLDFDQLWAAFAWTIVIGISPLFLHMVFYYIYAIWQTIFNAIRAWLGKPLEDILGMEEFGLLGVVARGWRKQENEKENEQKNEQEINRASLFGLLGVIQRAWRKQAIEKENEKENEQEKNRASVCYMINSRTEIVSSTFERYGLILSSIRVHPYGEKKYACDLTVESREGTELTDDVYIHVLLFDDNDYEMDRLDIRIRSKRFSGYLVKNNEDFSTSRDTVPTHMKIYVDKNW